MYTSFADSYTASHFSHMVLLDKMPRGSVRYLDSAEPITPCGQGCRLSLERQGKRVELLTKALDSHPPIRTYVFPEVRQREKGGFTARATTAFLRPDYLGDHRKTPDTNTAARAIEFEAQTIAAPLGPTRLQRCELTRGTP